MTNHPIEPHPALARAAIWMMPALDDLGYHTRVGDLTHLEVIDVARAVLMSLRDLPPDVVEAGGIAADHAPLAEEAGTFGEAYRPVARAAFTAMINTIIGESA